MKLKTNLILFCGLACSGKSTISKQVAKLLTEGGVEVEHVELDSYIKHNFPMARDERIVLVSKS